MGQATLSNTLSGTLDATENYTNATTFNISDWTSKNYEVGATWITNVIQEASYVIINNTGDNPLVWRIGDGTDYWRMELAAGQYVFFPLSYYQEFMTAQPATAKGLSLYSALGTSIEVIALF